MPGWRLNEQQTRELRFVAKVGEEDTAEFAIQTTYQADNSFLMKVMRVTQNEKGKKDHEVGCPLPAAPRD